MNKEIKLQKSPKVSAKKLIKNNWQMIKTVLKASPLGVSLFFVEAFRNQFLIFFEHTWLIKYVLECVEYHRPFKDAMWATIAMALIIATTSILADIEWQRLYPKAMLKAKTAFRNMMFDKAREVDLEKFDNPEYYNDFVMNVGKTDELVEKSFRIVQTLGETLADIFTTGVFFFTENIYIFFVVMAATAIKLFLSLKRNGYWFSKFKGAAPFYRKTDYTKRLFYLHDYAKEIRLNPDIKDEAFKTYDKSFDGLVDVLKFHDKKIIKASILDVFSENILLELLVMLILVYQASVLSVISFSMVVVMYNSTFRLSNSFRKIVMQISTTAENCMYVDKINEFLKTEPKIVSEKNLTVPKGACDVELENVSFRYNDKDGDVLKNITLKIKKGEKIALVGYNGAGKTTLIKLIMRLYDVTGGEIRLNDVDIRDYNVEQYRHNIGVIFQDFNIYAASIKENVTMSPCDNSCDGAVKSALDGSGFTNRLEKLENGIETHLTKEFDDDGLNLSGGENQKIAIARSFYKGAGLIILDEPSSALDPIAEYNFNKYLQKAAKDSTVIFISHRLSTTRFADRIYMLEHGQIVENGTHEQLLSSNGKYAQMWHAQADKYMA